MGHSMSHYQCYIKLIKKNRPPYGGQKGDFYGYVFCSYGLYRIVGCNRNR